MAMETSAGPQLAMPVPNWVLYQSRSSRLTCRDGRGVTKTYTECILLPVPTIRIVCPEASARNFHEVPIRERRAGCPSKLTGPGEKSNTSPGFRVRYRWLAGFAAGGGSCGAGV